MKSVLISLALVFTALASHADTVPGYTKVPQNKVEDYRRAILASITQNPTSVSACDPRWVHQTIDFLDEILVSDNSTQPLLLVNTHYAVNDGVLHRMVIVTTPDLKQIIQVLAEIYVMGEVNKGDLAHPVIAHDYILQSRTNCAQEAQH